MKNKLLFLLLGTIFVLSLSVRFINLSEFPTGFHIDEANLGYNAYSILMTGKDDNGNFLPLHHNMFDDFNPTGYHYLTVIPVAVFGLTEFATRFTAAIFGSFLIVAVFFLGFLVTNDKRVGILAALFTSLSPWGILFSRTSAETLVATFFVVTGFALLFYFLKYRKTYALPIATFFLILSFFIYPTPRLFVPLLLFATLFITRGLWWRELKKGIIISFVTVSVVAICLVLFVSGGTGRFSQVSIFTYPETKLVMEEQIREDGGRTSLIETRLFHNKAINYSYTFISNYFAYFSGEFLFTEGGYPRFLRVPHMGMLHLVQLPFLIYGFYQLARSKKKLSHVILAWVLLSPFVASITVDDIPNMRRALVMFPVLEVVVAYGFIAFITTFFVKYQKILVTLFALIFTYSVLLFLHQYFIHAQVHQNWYRNDGFDRMFDEVKKSYDSFDHILITKDAGGIYPLVLFHMKYDPSTYQAEGSTKDREYTGFGKFLFVPQACPSKDQDSRFPQSGRILYVEKGECDGVVLSASFIYREDGSKAFRLVYETNE